ncbi:unnamed protein product [Lampetra planeri]
MHPAHGRHDKRHDTMSGIVGSGGSSWRLVARRVAAAAATLGGGTEPHPRVHGDHVEATRRAAICGGICRGAARNPGGARGGSAATRFARPIIAPAHLRLAQVRRPSSSTGSRRALRKTQVDVIFQGRRCARGDARGAAELRAAVTSRHGAVRQHTWDIAGRVDATKHETDSPPRDQARGLELGATLRVGQRPAEVNMTELALRTSSSDLWFTKSGSALALRH